MTLYRGRLWSGPDDGMELSSSNPTLIRPEAADIDVDHPARRGRPRARVGWREVRYRFHDYRKQDGPEGVRVGVWIPEDIGGVFVDEVKRETEP